MKRSPLRRLTPLRRVGFKRTSKPRRHSNAEVVAQFAAEFTSCWRCGTSQGKLDVHHISRIRRWDVRENLARLCRRCHDLFHHIVSDFKTPQVIELKKKFDPKWFNEKRLEELLSPGRSERELRPRR